jgi:S1-C subfamily serine protease
MITNRRQGWTMRRTAIAAAVLVAIVLLALLFFQLDLIELGERGADEDVIESIGATMEPLDELTAETLGVDPHRGGLVVTSVSHGGSAAAAGVDVGDVVERVGGTQVHSLHEAARGIARENGRVTLTLNRGRDHAIVRVQIVPGHDRRSAAT